MRRFAVPSAIARSVCLSAVCLASACAGRGLTFATTTRPNDPNLLLSCARSVATDQGLGVVTQSTEPLELQAKSAVEASATASPAQTYDVLTVKLSPAKRGFEMLVGSASYVLRSLRPGAADAAKNEWVGTSPSPRVALARDAVLTRCGNLGN